MQEIVSAQQESCTFPCKHTENERMTKTTFNKFWVNPQSYISTQYLSKFYCGGNSAKQQPFKLLKMIQTTGDHNWSKQGFLYQFFRFVLIRGLYIKLVTFLFQREVRQNKIFQTTPSSCKAVHNQRHENHKMYFFNLTLFGLSRKQSKFTRSSVFRFL